MIPQLLDSTSIPLMEKLAAFTERRQEVLAENVANIDTPNYRRRDLPVEEFQDALKRAIQLKKANISAHYNTSPQYQLGLTRGQPSMQPELPAMRQPIAPELDQLFPRTMLSPEVAENEELIFRDNNNRSVEALMMQLTKNNMQHTFAIETMRSQMQMLEIALTGRL